MNKTMRIVIAAASLMGMTAAYADEPVNKPGRIHTRQERQQKRIGEGVENGSLTAKETAKLEHKEAKLNREIRHERAADGGKLTAANRAEINRKQNRLSKEIYKEKHDAQTQR